VLRYRCQRGSTTLKVQCPHPLSRSAPLRRMPWMTDSTRLDPSVHRATLFRAALVLLLWVATMRLRHHGAEVRLGLDLVLTAAGLWAIWPGRRRGGPLFGEHGHW